MSAATASDTPTDTPSDDDLPLPDRAWHLHCQGKPNTAIARELKLDRHTVARYLKQIHDETQLGRRADRSQILTQALGALAQIQADAWDQIERDKQHEHLVWDRYLRAAADAAAAAQGLGGGYTVRPPTYRPQTARLLHVILAAIREVARLELLDDAAAPARDGDDPADGEREHHMYIMMRRSDQEALAQLQRDRQANAPDGTAPGDASLSSEAPDETAGDASSDAATGDAPAMAPYEVLDADGQPPIPHDHPHPDLRPDGTDDWYVHSHTRLAPPGMVPGEQRLPGPPPRRRRPWQRAW